MTANHGQPELQAAVRLLTEITSQVGDEIMLVSPEGLEGQV